VGCQGYGTSLAVCVNVDGTSCLDMAWELACVEGAFLDVPASPVCPSRTRLGCSREGGDGLCPTVRSTKGSSLLGIKGLCLRKGDTLSRCGVSFRWRQVGWKTGHGPKIWRT
jgi:hypothetical protein